MKSKKYSYYIMSLIRLIMILIIIYIIWKLFIMSESFYPNFNDYYSDPEYITNNSIPYEEKKSWTDMIRDSSLDEYTLEKHREDILNNKAKFSSGAGFSVLEPATTSPLFTNFVGGFQPEFVDMQPNPRQIPDVDINLFKNNSRLCIKRAHT